jgi:3-phenylpropionate/cinnamic acid dioxygenase small subunit
MKFSDVTEKDLLDFVYLESDLLDEAKYDEWLDLFHPEAFYWMPLERGQLDPKLHCSLMYENKFLLDIRIRRLSGHRTYSQQPKSFCHHLLQKPNLLKSDPVSEQWQLKTSFQYTETKGDAQRSYVGWFVHDLMIHQEKIKILLKRVDLVNPDAAFSNINLFM